MSAMADRTPNNLAAMAAFYRISQPLDPQILLLGRPQGDRAAVRPDEPVLPPVWLRPDDGRAMAARLSGAAGPDRGRMARRSERAWRRHAPGVLQPARGDARHGDGVPRRRAAGRRRLRKLSDPPADRRGRHGIPASQHGELLA